MTDANGKNHRQFKHNLRPRKFADVQVLTLSRRKQGFESPRERQRNQRLIVRSPVGVQQLSNKRLRTGMDDRAQTPPRFIGDSTWMSRTGSRPNRLGSVSSPVR